MLTGGVGKHRVEVSPLGGGLAHQSLMRPRSGDRSGYLAVSVFRELSEGERHDMVISSCLRCGLDIVLAAEDAMLISYELVMFLIYALEDVNFVAG